MTISAAPTTSLHDAALEYARRGWPVFPLVAGQKRPATANGFKDGTTSVFEVDQWWSEYPDANIGVACGGLFVVVDVDQHGVDGERGLAALENVHGALPETLTSRTGGGGRHCFFKHPGGYVKSRPLARGVDIKSDGGYVVLPPSRLDDGGDYVWLIEIDDALLSEAWVAALQAPTARERITTRSHTATRSNSSELYAHNFLDVATPYGEAALRNEIERMKEAPRGERNSTLNRTAFNLGQLVSGGQLPEQRVRDVLCAAAEAAFRGDDKPGEIEGTLNSGLTAGMNIPRGPSNNADEPWFVATAFGEKFVPAILGEIIRDEGRVLLGDDGRLYKYERGVYLPNGDNYVTARAAEELGHKYHRSYVAEVLAWMRATYATIGTSQPSLTTLNVANGLLNWESGQLDPHTPTFLSTAQIPVAWNPDATCPVVSQFLEDILPDDAVPFVLEIIGYALYAGNPFTKAIQLLGPGGNGKSKLLHLIRSLVGPKNVASVPLQAFAENRFAPASLFEKLANICGDLDARAIKRTDMFKMMTGGDVLHAEHKYMNPFTFTSYALPIFSANEPPISSDQSDAWFDRWLVIPLERRFRGTGDDDPFIGDKITAPDELEGLLVLAVEGLRNLIARGGFDVPGSARAAGEGYRERLDTVRGFVVEECLQDVAATVERGTLYRTYKKWCEDSGRYSLSAGQFCSHLRAMGFLEARDRGRIWRGLKLRDQPNPPGF